MKFKGWRNRSTWVAWVHITNTYKDFKDVQTDLVECLAGNDGANTAAHDFAKILAHKYMGRFGVVDWQEIVETLIQEHQI